MAILIFHPAELFFVHPKGNLNKNCGPIQYEPQSIEGGIKDSLKVVLPDGEIASGGKATFLL